MASTNGKSPIKVTTANREHLLSLFKMHAVERVTFGIESTRDTLDLFPDLNHRAILETDKVKKAFVFSDALKVFSYLISVSHHL